MEGAECQCPEIGRRLTRNNRSGHYIDQKTKLDKIRSMVPIEDHIICGKATMAIINPTKTNINGEADHTKEGAEVEVEVLTAALKKRKLA